MPNENQLIRTITDPTIVLDDIIVKTDEKSTDENEKNISPLKTAKMLGGAAPIVQINNKIFTGEEIISVIIESEGSIPHCYVSLMIMDKSFYSRAFPKDGDLVSLFIRSKDDSLKPIRNDYVITSVSVSSDYGAGELSYDKMSISGILWIPGYHDIRCFSKSGTSYDVLLKVSSDLKLGFASNEISTDDYQTWICPNEKFGNFLTNVSSASWKNSNSFFHSYIDPFYYFNLVNVDCLFSEKTEIEEGLCMDLLTNDYGNENYQGKATGKVVLSNWQEFSSTPFFIVKYSLFNESSRINNTYGYKRYVEYYDGFTKEKETLFVDPLISPDSEKDKMILKGRPNEDYYLTQVQSDWMGIQYGENGENCHEKYNYAKIQNFQNVVHLGKMGLNVTLQSINFNLRRMQSVPVVIIIKKDTTRKIANTPLEDDGYDDSGNVKKKKAVDAFDSPFLVDQTISGYYVIWSMRYVFKGGAFRQELFMVRREWPIPSTFSEQN